MANFNFIKKALPFVGTALQIGLPGPVGNVAKMLTDKLGKPMPSKASTLADTVEQLLGDPAQLAALKDVEQQFQAHMTEMGYAHTEEMEQIAASDRASARQMQSVTRSKLPGVLAVVITAGFFGLLALMAFHPPPPQSEKLLDSLTASVGTAWIMVVTFYFGSSNHTERQTEIIANGAAQAKT